MARSKQAISVPVVAVLLLSGCGGDDDAPAGEAADAEVADDGASSADDAPETDAGVPVATDLTPEDDLVAGIMTAMFGPESAEFLTADERECMNQVLSPSFPTGLPPELAATTEFEGVRDALDTAAEVCNVEL